MTTGPLGVSSLGTVLTRVRDRAPLVHCITAAVSMNLVADALLAAGARPMMTETLMEAPALVRHADALLVNLGTLSTDGFAGMVPTVEVAGERGLQWVLDPAAVGPTEVRRDLARRLLGHRPSVVRANASEVRALAGGGRGGRGPDSLLDSRDVTADVEQVLQLGARVVSVSGVVDRISTEGLRAEVCGGHPLLTRVTGTGCTLGGLTAACCAVADPFTAALTASIWLAVAAERAAAASRGPGSFKVALLDELSLVEPWDLTGRTELR